MKTFTRLIFRWHSRLGMIAGIFFLLFFVTGSFIVFESELEHWQNPHLMRVRPQGTHLSFTQIYQKTREQRPDLVLLSFRHIPQAPGETIEMRVYDSGTRTYPLLYVNPHDGQVLGLRERSVYDTMIQLHYTFGVGKFGETMAALFAFALLGSILTGLWVYRKHLIDALLLRTRVNWKNPLAASSGLHRIIGVWTLLFHCLMAFTGFYMMLYALDIRNHFGTGDSFTPDQVPHWTLNLDALAVQARQAIPGLKLTYIDFPRSNEGVLRFSGDLPGRELLGNTASQVDFDFRYGQIRQIIREDELSAHDVFDYSLYSLHYGQFGGITLKCIYAFLAVLGACLTISGWFLWWRRTQRKKG